MEDNIDDEYLVDILEYEDPQRLAILVAWMDEHDLTTKFGRKRRPSSLDQELAILNKELSFQKINMDINFALLECKMEMVNNMVETLEQEKV